MNTPAATPRREAGGAEAVASGDRRVLDHRGQQQRHNDAAAAVALVERDYADAEKLTVLATVKAWAAAGVAPRDTGLGAVTTLVYELQRRGGGIGVAAMCAGGGQGGAVVVEV